MTHNKESLVSEERNDHILKAMQTLALAGQCLASLLEAENRGDLRPVQALLSNNQTTGMFPALLLLTNLMWSTVQAAKKKN